MRKTPSIVILLILVLTILGFTPAFFALDRLKYLLYFSLGYSLIGIIHILRRKYTTESNPGLLAVLLSTLSGIGNTSAIGINFIVYYYFFYGIVWLATTIASWLGAHWDPNYQNIAFYTSFSLIVLISIMSVLRIVENSSKQLYPLTLGTKHAFYELITERRQTLKKMALLATIALIIIIGFFYIVTFKTNKVFYIVLQLYFFYSCYSLRNFAVKKEFQPDKSSDIIEAISRLLEAIGYKVILSPRTGNPDVDPILAGLDLFAQSDNSALAIEIKYPKKVGNHIDWTQALSVRSVARTLSSVSKEEMIPTDSVLPILVLVNGKPDNDLQHYTSDENIKLVEITTNDISEIQKSEELSELRLMAAKLFGEDIMCQTHDNFAGNDYIKEEQ